MEEEEEDTAAIIVRTVEHLEGDYGSYTWPCAPVLSEYAAHRRGFLRGKRVLEIGSGTSVCGIVAAKCGAHVTLSDHEGNPHVHDNLRYSCQLNGVAGVEVRGVTWGTFSPAVLQLKPVDVILASDCFYDSNDFEDIISLASYLMAKSSCCQLWTAYQERSSNRSLLPLLERWGLQCMEVPLQSFWCEEKRRRVRVEGRTVEEPVHTIHVWLISQTQS